MALLKGTPAVGLKQDLDRVFDRFFAEPFWGRQPARGFEHLWEPPLDFSETEKEYVVRLEVPGMAREDFDVQLDGNLLTLSGKKEMHREQKGEDFLWQEREAGRFMRTLRLPGRVEEAKVDASYHDGILKIVLPKGETPVTNRIAIK